MSSTQLNNLLKMAHIFIKNELGFKADLTYREWDGLLTIRKAGQKKVQGYLSGTDYSNFEIIEN